MKKIRRIITTDYILEEETHNNIYKDNTNNFLDNIIYGILSIKTTLIIVLLILSLIIIFSF